MELLSVLRRIVSSLAWIDPKESMVKVRIYTRDSDSNVLKIKEATVQQVLTVTNDVCLAISEDELEEVEEW